MNYEAAEQIAQVSLLKFSINKRETTQQSTFPNENVGISFFRPIYGRLSAFRQTVRLLFKGGAALGIQTPLTLVLDFVGLTP